MAASLAGWLLEHYKYQAFDQYYPKNNRNNDNNNNNSSSNTNSTAGCLAKSINFPVQYKKQTQARWPLTGGVRGRLRSLLL
jgi:hypothetical protein